MIKSFPLTLAHAPSLPLFPYTTLFRSKGLTKPRTAVRGNKLAAAGMLIAVVLTLLHKGIISYKLIILGGIIGATIGVTLAKRIEMTAMPQLVAALNGFGGGSSVAIAAAEYFTGIGALQTTITMTALGITTMVGAVTLTGSFVAFAKLQELIDGKPKIGRAHV